MHTLSNFQELIHGKIIIGLGNPGIQYKDTPHNLGFMFIDHILAQHKLTSTALKLEHQDAWIISGSNTVLTKPTTYMNLSGYAVRAIYRKMYRNKLSPNDFMRSVIVVHDDTTIPIGDIKLKDGLIHVGSGGHNGIRHIVQIAKEIGCDDQHSTGFYRLRLGCAPIYDCVLKDYVCKKMPRECIEMWRDIMMRLC
jgi:PTH1 family peptidyl-tRNA hydrolase